VLRPTPDGEEAIIIDHGGSWASEKIPFPHEDVAWPLTPKDKGTRKRRLNEFAEINPQGKIIIVNMVETKAPMRLVTTTSKRELAKGNDLARMNAAERAEFFRQKNPVKAAAHSYEQALIPSLLESLNRPGALRNLPRPGAARGRSMARPR
jgi:hypothetical protein